jgi:hypothetical protein
MREKLGPWVPAIFCAVLSLITVLGDLVGRFTTGVPGAVDLVFYCFLPMCFYFAGAYLSQLRQENRDLRVQIQSLLPKPIAGRQVA